MSNNRKFRRMVDKMSDKAKLGVVRKAADLIIKHPERYTEEQVERALELLREAEEKVAGGSSNEPPTEEAPEPAERDEP